MCADLRESVMALPGAIRQYLHFPELTFVLLNRFKLNLKYGYGGYGRGYGGGYGRGGYGGYGGGVSTLGVVEMPNADY